MAEAIHVNKSGSIVKGPNPESLNPASVCTKGLDIREYNSRAAENMINPRLNCDLVVR
jgi:hypothetical protein